ncbi:MAG: 50S ribosomal protein L18 [Deltaproteobacteria bacterium]|nr:50S ribosomal protein L18 [Deltaproteobacteria bacterium]
MDGRTANISGWERRKSRVRKKVRGTQQRPRLNVYRSNKHIYAQIVDDASGVTLAASSSNSKDFADADVKKSETAKKVGEKIARLALEKGIDCVVFDRSGYLYHGRIKALAEGAREAGLKF